MSIAQPSSPSLSVLLVENHSETRRMYTLALNAAGVQVVEARDGAEALACLGERLPHVVVTGITVPKVDGLELLARVRRDHAQVPVIILTAWSDASSQARATSAGAAAFLAKPCLPDVLVSTIQRVLTNAPRAAERASDTLQSG